MGGPWQSTNESQTREKRNPGTEKVVGCWGKFLKNVQRQLAGRILRHLQAVRRRRPGGGPPAMVARGDLNMGVMGLDLFGSDSIVHSDVAGVDAFGNEVVD